MKELGPAASSASAESDAAALEVLEARVAEVEARVFGPRGAAASPSVGAGGAGEGAQSVAEAIASAHTMLLASTSGREKAASLLHQRLPELDGYLRLVVTSTIPGERGSEAAAAQWELVQREEPAILLAAERLRRLSELQSSLDPGPLCTATDLQPSLRTLAAAALDDLARAEGLAQKVAELRKQQLTTLDNVRQGLALLEHQVSRLEVAAQPKKPLD